MSRIRSEYLDAGPLVRSVATDVLVREEPDDDEEDDGKDENDEEREDEGYSE